MDYRALISGLVNGTLMSSSALAFIIGAETNSQVSYATSAILGLGGAISIGLSIKYGWAVRPAPSYHEESR